MSTQPAPVESSLWGVLRYRAFRALFIAITISNVGTWMNDVGAAWLMTTLTSESLPVALLQTASALPFFLLAYPAGALADLIDRRRYLVATHLWMIAVAVALAALTIVDAVTPWLLLGLVFALGVGNAAMRPAWAASIPSMAPPQDLRYAVTLNAMSTNATRAIGPAIGGVLLVAGGPELVFSVNAFTFTVMLWALWRHWPEIRRAPSNLPVERFAEALRTGLRYARHSPALLRIQLRGAIYFTFAIAGWALLPVVVVRELGAGPLTYGLLMAFIGVGAIGGASALPRLRPRLGRNGLLRLATLGGVVALLGLAWTRSVPLLAAFVLLSGAAWIVAFSVLVVAAQVALPDWVRARGLALMMLSFGGASAAGGALWGRLADTLGVAESITIAALAMLVAGIACWRVRIHERDTADLAPSMQWPTPEPASPVRPDRGPVLVTAEYRVRPEDVPEFLRAMRDLRRIRRRHGAFFWEVFQDIDDPERYVEAFLTASWLEHLRHHERVTGEDRRVSERLRALHRGPGEPRVTHLVAARTEP